MANLFEIASFNLHEFAKRFWDTYGNPTQMDVQVPQKDANGNVTIYSVPNRAKFKQQIWDDVGSALGQFNRSFYVDAVSGDDTNNGTNSSPFKTLKKAIQSIPVSGYATISLMSDITINEVIDIATPMSVKIHSVGTRRTITFPIDETKNPTYGFSGFYFYKGDIRLSFENVKLVSPNYTGTRILYNRSAPLGNCGVKDGRIVSFLFYDCAIEVNNVPFITNPVVSQAAGNLFAVQINGCSITANDQPFIYAGGYPLIFTRISTTINNESKMIFGITKDTNGVPRNIVSNVIL